MAICKEYLQNKNSRRHVLPFIHDVSNAILLSVEKEQIVHLLLGWISMGRWKLHNLYMPGIWSDTVCKGGLSQGEVHWKWLLPVSATGVMLSWMWYVVVMSSDSSLKIHFCGYGWSRYITADQRWSTVNHTLSNGWSWCIIWLFPNHIEIISNLVKTSTQVW